MTYSLADEWPSNEQKRVPVQKYFSSSFNIMKTHADRKWKIEDQWFCKDPRGI